MTPVSSNRPLAGLPPLRAAFAVWGLGALLYLIGFYHRVAPAVITRELMSEFAIGAAALGNLSALYYYSYVAIQVPAGVLSDRFGPRRILATGAAFAAAGTVLFALAPTYAGAGLGRLLIGGSVGVAFVAMLKLAGHWFASTRFGMISGLALATGILGAVSAGVPLRLLVDAFGWRGVMGAMAVVTAALAVAIWTIVRDDPRDRGYASHVQSHHDRSQPVFAGIRRAFASRNIWLVVLVSGAVSGPTLTFGGLWGVPFLTTHYGFTTSQASMATSLLLACWAVSSPSLGALSDRLRLRKPVYVAGAVLATVGWACVLMIEGLPPWMLVTLLAFTGCVSGSAMLGFAIAKESAPPELGGTAGGIANMGNMLGGMVMQPAVGWVLDQRWTGALENGVRIYDFEAYRAGFSLMLGWLALSLLTLVFLRETHCRQAN